MKTVDARLVGGITSHKEIIVMKVLWLSEKGEVVPYDPSYSNRVHKFLFGRVSVMKKIFLLLHLSLLRPHIIGILSISSKSMYLKGDRMEQEGC
jgi:hypothetical protein